MDPADFDKSVEAYKLVENILLLRGATKEELTEKTCLEAQEVRNIVGVAEEKGIIEEDPQDRGSVYRIDRRGLAHYWLHLWQERSHDGLALPDKMPGFLYDYCESYFQLEKVGTIRGMLVEDFFQGLMVKRLRGTLPAWLEEVYTLIEDDYEGLRGPQKHIDYALEG